MKLPFFKPLEPVAASYKAAGKAKLPKNKDVADLTIIALDAETTGFQVGTDRILSLAAIKISDRQVHVSSAKNWLVYQDKAPVNEAMEVHGILPSETAEGRPEKEVIGELLPLLGNKLIVGHHIAFDIAVLNDAAKRHFRISLKNRVLDTALLARQEINAFQKTGYANQPPPKLEEVCTALGIETMDRHTALGDTFTTALVFLTLCARIRRKLERPVRFTDLPISRA